MKFVEAVGLPRNVSDLTMFREFANQQNAHTVIHFQFYRRFNVRSAVWCGTNLACQESPWLVTRALRLCRIAPDGWAFLVYHSRDIWRVKADSIHLFLNVVLTNCKSVVWERGYAFLFSNLVTNTDLRKRFVAVLGSSSSSLAFRFFRVWAFLQTDLLVLEKYFFFYLKSFNKWVGFRICLLPV